MRIAVITHPLDMRLRSAFGGRLLLSRPFYQLDAILRAGRSRGLRWFFTDPGQPFRPADAAILHVDMSLIPQDYLDLAARYPVTVNGRVADIRKRHVSQNLLRPGDDWAGPVLVKSDLNAGGGSEGFQARRLAQRSGQPLPVAPRAQYRVLDSLRDVPDAVWSDPALVVERFLPERRGAAHVLRIWSFLGDYERCTWYSANETIVKARHILDFGPSEVPEELRRQRERLGFDYGKFDFAIGPQGPVLFDANRTPAFLRKRPDLMRQAGDSMSAALIRLIRGA